MLKNYQVRGRPRRDPDRQGADRRLRPDHALELADQPDRLQGGPGARHRLHHGAEAVGRWRRSRGYIWAEIMDAAGVPAGVFNMVNGDGAGVGAAISSHPGVDMVSFTGSTRAGIEVAKAAAPTVKRVAQELGGKSPNIILEDADMKTAVGGGVSSVMSNSGQSCNAPTRMLVPGQEDGRGHRHRQGGRRSDHRRRSERQRPDGPGGLRRPSGRRSSA